MGWVIGAVVLALAGLVLHRILYSCGESVPMRSPVDPLPAAREKFYRPVAQEIEMGAGMIAVSLNEAFEEDQKRNADSVCRLLFLAESEWQRLDQTLLAVQNLMLKYRPLLTFAVPLRRATRRHYRSAIMLDHVRTHEEIEQFVYRPKLSFHMHIIILRSGERMLTAEFRRSASEARSDPSALRRQWSLLDFLFHDFDLIGKESLLALRMVLAALPGDQLSEFAVELDAALRRDVSEPLIVPRP
jgi:hypothetical protein